MFPSCDSWLLRRLNIFPLLLSVFLGCCPAHNSPAALVPTPPGAASTFGAASVPVVATPRPPAAVDSRTEAGPRNVVLLLSDGTAPEAWTLARWVKGSSLHVDRILTGAIRTYGADSIITDSAPGATAYATGKKGSDKGISVGAWRHTIAAAKFDPKRAYVPLATLLEGAHLSGFATGLVATSSIQHATPAAFSAHVADREQYNEIAEQQVYQGIDVALAGGSQYLLPKSVPGGMRADGEDLVAVLKQRGYRFVTSKAQLLASPSGRTWGAFAPNDMAYEIDRQRFVPSQPALSEMTDYALTNLATSDRGKSKGFFLFIEGSKVDWAAHDNDPIGVVSELIAFDDAVGCALRFAQTHPSTQVIALADHSTGGLTIGSNVDANYSSTDDDLVVAPLRRAKMTAERLGSLLTPNRPDTEIANALRTEWGILDPTPAEIGPISTALRQHTNPKYALARLISQRARIGWTSLGHTGADVMLFAHGPEHPKGFVENTAINQGIAQYLGLDLARLQSRLFVDAQAALSEFGLAVSLDRSDANNGRLLVTRGARRAILPWAKNLLLTDHRSVELEGIVVYAPKLDRVFVPQQAIDWLTRELH